MPILRKTKRIAAIALWLWILPAASWAAPKDPPQTRSATAAQAPESAPSSRPAETKEADKKAAEKLSLADRLPEWVAAIIGGFGAIAYLVALVTGLVGKDNEATKKILEHFDPPRYWKVICPRMLFYVLSGAGVALVFQMPETKLVPIQAFIIGCTWPAVVANYLSGRQVGDAMTFDQEEKLTKGLQERAKENARLAEAEAQAKERLKKPVDEANRGREAAQEEFKKLLEQNKLNPAPGANPPLPPAAPGGVAPPAGG